MKALLFFGAALCLSGCISTSEIDQEKAYAECRNMPSKARRDNCIAEVLQQSERDRQEAADEQRQRDEAAEQRQINRVIGGADKD